MMDSNLWQINTQIKSPLDSPNGSLSKLDLKAPGKARREYEKGYRLLLTKDLNGAVEHLTQAITIYPSFVAAHNALGTAYLGLGQNDQARAEFAKAISLDDHLPASYLNLGCAQLALKQYPAAEESIQKASAIAPLDLQLLTALAYGQYMNKDYSGAVTTAQKIHERKHEGASIVHLYAAAALEAQQNFPAAESELNSLLKEDPKSQAASQAHQLMDQLKEEEKAPAPSAPELKATFTLAPSEPAPGTAAVPLKVQKMMQDAKENAQLAEAEAEPEAGAVDSSGSATTVAGAASSSQPNASANKFGGLVLRASADEVAMFFAATDHGRSVTDLTGKNVAIRDNRKPPAAVTGFRNESELPLRMGLVIDTSNSISGRFKFEQASAANFLQRVVTHQDDLAFVVGFSNSVLLVQDFTNDQKAVSHAVQQLVPSGGTALWDAVAFAAEKLSSRHETQPVAKILVVISDGDDNSSSATAKEAINRAQRGEVTIYTVSTREFNDTVVESLVGEHALKTLADLTGGAAFTPGSVHRLNGSLNDLQQVIRSRYLVSYKPALFKRNGEYRPIDIVAEKDGHKLHVYARKGYFAYAGPSTSGHSDAPAPAATQN